MKEITEIINSFEIAEKQGLKTALATVVNVVGSSYRRPGARMLVTEDGMLTGAISGGCLEGDALKKALLAINENKNKLVTYDTTDNDDAKFGVQLGCNGIVHILFEPINTAIKNNPIAFLKEIISERKEAVLTTFFSLEDKNSQIGTKYLINKSEILENTQADISSELEKNSKQDAISVLENKVSISKDYKLENQTISSFIEFVKPMISIVIFGAGNDALPLVLLCNLLGWQTTIIDGRRSHATRERFKNASTISISDAENALKNVTIDKQTFFILMTHNYNYDIEILRQLSQIDCRYIGILGPKKKLHRMFDELSGKGIFITESQKEKIFSPIGLDLGAETSEEIALSIVAEIQAFIANKNGQPLRLKEENIHS
ncbi:XdhC family protein [uncultured Flavobacterium sp.]|uniref:XdhC family protein n=1 Tax=uncultured Flavobacterium sp. TaxID=165435 RepID=UPI0025DD41DA|nr:XdhC/CoxI family protein [uncultured Flavobacterium sp.]